VLIRWCRSGDCCGQLFRCGTSGWPVVVSTRRGSHTWAGTTWIWPVSVHRCSVDTIVRYQSASCIRPNSTGYLHNIRHPRDAFRGQSRSPNMVPFHVKYGFLLECYSNFVPKTRCFSDIRLQKGRDLETRVRGPWRSLKMSPFDTEPMTSYWCSIATMALSRVVFDKFNVKEYRDLESPVKGHSRSLKVVPSIDWSIDPLPISFL